MVLVCIWSFTSKITKHKNWRGVSDILCLITAPVLVFLNLLQHKLCRAVEESPFYDSLAFPALIRKLLHLRDGAVTPFKAKYPANDHRVARHEYWSHTFGSKFLRFCQHAALDRHVRITSNARLGLVFTRITTRPRAKTRKCFQPAARADYRTMPVSPRPRLR